MAEHLLQCVSIAARGNAVAVLGTLGRPQLDSTGSDMCMLDTCMTRLNCFLVKHYS